MIHFTVQHWKDEDLARAIALLFYQEPSTFYDEHAKKWQIGIANDLWLHPKENKTYVLNYRYGTLEEIQALANMLKWRLGVKITKVE